MPKEDKKVTLEGKPIPHFELQSTNGETITPESLRGKKAVLYFYPKDMTPGCTVEGQQFSKLKAQFLKKNAVVLGISRDSVDSHKKFQKKDAISVDLLSDTSQTACDTFNVMKQKNMYGKKVMGVERSTFVIDEKGIVRKEWRGVKADGHAEEVLEFLRGL